LGVGPAAHVAVPDLTAEEVGELVTAAGGDAATWAQWVYAGGEFGHPQLVQAIIAGLRSRSWPQAELKSLRAFNRTSEVEAEQRATRLRLVAAVPEDAKSLL